MALATQCPYCHTKFRVAADQLKLRGGIVRCGACQSIFDGNAHLIDLAPAPAAAAVPAPAPAPAPVSAPTPEPVPASVAEPVVADDDVPVYTLDFGHTFDPLGILPKAVEPDEVVTALADEQVDDQAPEQVHEEAEVVAEHGADSGAGPQHEAVAAEPAAAEPAAADPVAAEPVAIEPAAAESVAAEPAAAEPAVDEPAVEDPVVDEPAAPAPAPAPAPVAEDADDAESVDDVAVSAPATVTPLPDAPGDTPAAVESGLPEPAPAASSDALAPDALAPDALAPDAFAPATHAAPLPGSYTQPDRVEPTFGPADEAAPEAPPAPAVPEVDLYAFEPEHEVGERYATAPHASQVVAPADAVTGMATAEAEVGATADAAVTGDATSAADTAPSAGTAEKTGSGSAADAAVYTEAVYTDTPSAALPLRASVAHDEPVADPAGPPSSFAAAGGSPTRSARARAAEARARRSKLTPTPIDSSPKLRMPESDEPEFVKRSRRKEQTGRARRIAMGAGCALLLVALAVQAVREYRNVLAARYPGMRPVLEAVCAPFGCRVGLPAQVDNLVIETGELHPLGHDTYSLNTLLRNQGSLVQAWPSIELELIDDNDKPLLRRVFGPADYLPAATASGFAARSEQPVRIDFAVTGPQPAGYHLFVFYP